MKIIQIVGRSNTGKTTFIKNLIPLLKQNGNVGIIKHLGDHDFQLEEGKDTTQFFVAGADIAMGIDSHKSVVAIRDASLSKALDLFACQGIDYAVIEGFKQEPFPKIVIGSLEIDHCVLTNPRIEDVIGMLHRFADYPPVRDRED